MEKSADLSTSSNLKNNQTSTSRSNRISAGLNPALQHQADGSYSHLSFNDFFFPLLQLARAEDHSLDKACKKISKKIEAYARSLGIPHRELRVLDVCDSSANIHPKLRQYIHNLPRKPKQPVLRHQKYREEILSNVCRAVKAVIDLINGSGETQNRNVLINPDHPILVEIIKALPKNRKRGTGGKFKMGKSLSELGLNFYCCCAQVIEGRSPASVQDFLSEYRREIFQSIKQNCPPEKISSVIQIISRLDKHFGVSVKRRGVILPVGEWPSPIREEMQVLKDVCQGKLLEGLRVKASLAGIKIHSRISPPSYEQVRKSIGSLISNNPVRTSLSVTDFFSFNESRSIGPDGREIIEYHNDFLTPYRNVERARVSESKRAGFDSVPFAITVSSVKTLASYNGFFEGHMQINRAFEIKLDSERREERKAEKKLLIDRHALDEWLNDNWNEYEQIIKRGTFKRDKSRRPHKDSDRAMRFLQFYLELITLKVMGYRQRQLRDCVYGENLIVTQDSIVFSYPREKVKNGKPLRFRGDIHTCNATHGKLIQAHYQYHRYVYPYIQNNLASWRTGNEEKDKESDPRGQVFLYLICNGTFKRFKLWDNRTFACVFKSQARMFLKLLGLQREAILLIHPHYIRGASMDTMIIDNGATSDAASRYYGDSVNMIDQNYKDRHAVQDASGDVVLINARLEEIRALQKRDKMKDRELAEAQARIADLEQKLKVKS